MIPASSFTDFRKKGHKCLKKSTVFILHFAPSRRFILSLQSAFYTQSAFYPWSQSAVRSLRFTLTGCDYSLVHNFLMAIYSRNFTPKLTILTIVFTGICCTFDWPPKDDHILMVGFLKMTHFESPTANTTTNGEIALYSKKFANENISRDMNE